MLKCSAELEKAVLLRVLCDSFFFELDARHGTQVPDDPDQVVCGVQFSPASRVAASIGQPFRVSPDTVVCGGEAPSAVLLALDDLLADVAHRWRESSRVAAPNHQGMGLAGVTQVRPRPSAALALREYHPPTIGTEVAVTQPIRLDASLLECLQECGPLCPGDQRAFVGADRQFVRVRRRLVDYFVPPRRAVQLIKNFADSRREVGTEGGSGEIHEEDAVFRPEAGLLHRLDQGSRINLLEVHVDARPDVAVPNERLAGRVGQIGDRQDWKQAGVYRPGDAEERSHSFVAEGRRRQLRVEERTPVGPALSEALPHYVGDFVQRGYAPLFGVGLGGRRHHEARANVPLITGGQPAAGRELAGLSP